MWYVYILLSTAFPAQEYIGATADLRRRLTDHNAGKSTHTAKFMPWELVWYCAFPDKHKALEFEIYLKSHSGRAFSKKRLLQQILGAPVADQAALALTGAPRRPPHGQGCSSV